MTSSGRSSDPSAGGALDTDAIEERLEAFLFAAPSHRSATRIARGLATLPRQQQEFALRWAEIAAQSYTEIGYQIALLAPQALRQLDTGEAEAWCLAALELFDKQGGRQAMDFLRDIDGFAARRGRSAAIVEFDAVEARLGRLVQGLSGRPLHVERLSAGSVAWTDTAAVHLPPRLAEFDTAAANRALYKATAAILWAQTRFGTFNVDPEPALAAWGEREDGLAWLAALEALRLEACIGRELPGLAAEIAGVRGDWPAALATFRDELERPDASVHSSLACLDRLRQAGAAAPRLRHAGRLDPAAAGRVRAERIERDKLILRTALQARTAGRRGTANATPPELPPPGAAAAMELRLDGELLALPPEARAAARSLLQDLGEIPPECLMPAGPGPWSPSQRRGDEPASRATGLGARQPDCFHDEWDFRRNAYRRGWCHLFEHVVPAGDADFVPATRQRHAGLIRQVRRRFEMLRGEDRIMRRQPEGEEVDVDALIEARADRRSGAEPSNRLYCRRQRHERSLAVMFMVDMSGSTKGWINDAEREALVMLGEAVETLGDAWAVYGFSGWTRTRCDIYRVKGFAERYDAQIGRRIAGVEPKDYTRMGVAIRHLTRLLGEQPAKHRLLVTLSDGKPDDFADEYRSQYGIEDTRRALLEARLKGVRSYCVTIDRQGGDYLRHMYGPARFTVLDDVRKLPLKIADIYRRLTT